MKKLLFFLITGLIISCSSGRRSYTNLQDDELSLTRRYIGNFLDYHHTGPEIFGGFDLIWIRTTQFPTFGKISAYGKECEFKPGDRIYLKRLYSTPGRGGLWEYQIENDFSVTYRMSNYRYENNVLAQAAF